jgi:hypothetical protein
MRIRPPAIGRFVVPTERAWLKDVTPLGQRNPIATPIAIARKIQRVR